MEHKEEIYKNIKQYKKHNLINNLSNIGALLSAAGAGYGGFKKNKNIMIPSIISAAALSALGASSKNKKRTALENLKKEFYSNPYIVKSAAVGSYTFGPLLTLLTGNPVAGMAGSLLADTLLYPQVAKGVVSLTENVTQKTIGKNLGWEPTRLKPTLLEKILEKTKLTNVAEAMADWAIKEKELRKKRMSPIYDKATNKFLTKPKPGIIERFTNTLKDIGIDYATSFTKGRILGKQVAPYIENSNKYFPEITKLIFNAVADPLARKQLLDKAELIYLNTKKGYNNIYDAVSEIPGVKKFIDSHIVKGKGVTLSKAMNNIINEVISDPKKIREFSNIVSDYTSKNILPAAKNIQQAYSMLQTDPIIKKIVPNITESSGKFLDEVVKNPVKSTSDLNKKIEHYITKISPELQKSEKIVSKLLKTPEANIIKNITGMNNKTILLKQLYNKPELLTKSLKNLSYTLSNYRSGLKGVGLGLGAMVAGNVLGSTLSPAKDTFSSIVSQLENTPTQPDPEKTKLNVYTFEQKPLTSFDNISNAI